MGRDGRRLVCWVSTRGRDLASSVARLLNLPTHAVSDSVAPGSAPRVSTGGRDLASSVVRLLNLPTHAVSDSVAPG
ncbi:hypothetical protein CXG46_20310 [Nocardioides alpinus]|uniref:Uncharacterized protein n=1 Tax=Nocardioides alpinus TaxID=748909 RepID=A0ABX4QSV6_9ACTN|nr:hypothetical protein CXG46_20310 [Nocardioides alpinus]